MKRQLDLSGEMPDSLDALVGDWVQSFHFGPGAPAKPEARVTFGADGAMRSTALNGRYDNTRDQWEFRPGPPANVSLWSWYDAAPEYGLDTPGRSEDRYHVLMKDPAGSVLFNGDGSIVMVYDPVD